MNLLLLLLAIKAIQVPIVPAESPGWNDCASGSYCLTGFTLYETTSGSPTPVAVLPQVATTYVMGYPSAGSHTYEVVQDATNGVGSPIQSTGNHGFVLNCVKVSGGRKCVLKKQW